MKKIKLSTSTVTNGTQVVPWLASSGPLSYSPESPPERDYYFQYTWVIPEIFHHAVNKREHRYFGYPFKDHYEIKDLLDFWNDCRKKTIERIYFSTGSITEETSTSPVAIYRHKTKNIFIQHGSYQFIDEKKQTALKNGVIYLYRGIGEDTVYKQYRINSNSLYKIIASIHAKSLIDSVTSFNTVHSNVKRSETSALNHDTFVLYDHARELNHQHEDEIISILNSGYSFDQNYGSRKFGPNHVVFKTPLSNVRITTFFCGEDEVKIIDPNKLEVIQEVGCKVKEILLL